MNRLRRFAHAVLGLALLATTSVAAQAPAPSEPANLAQLLSAAAKDGTLEVAYGDDYGGAEGAREIQDGIFKKWHVKLAIQYSAVANGAAFQNQMAQEVRVGQASSADIFFHVRDGGLAQFAQPVDYRKYLPGLPEAAEYFDHRSVVVVTTINAMIYNTKLVPANRVPQSFADLLKPEWKGKIASSPYQGEFGAYLGLPDALGHDGMTRFYQGYSKQLAGVVTCGQVDRVSSGEFSLFGLDCGDHETRMFQREGKPLGIIYPREATSLSTFAPGIPLTAAHPNAARLFIVFLLTPEGQAILWNLMGGDSALLPGSHMRAIIDGARRHGVRFIQTYGLDVQHPELRDYAKEINAIVNRSN